METVLVFGSSGNIGVSTIIAALHSGRKVLAVVRNKAAEDKIAGHVGTRDGITFAHAEVTDEQSVKKVVDRVRAGELPAFQHVYSAGTYICIRAYLSSLTFFCSGHLGTGWAYAHPRHRDLP